MGDGIRSRIPHDILHLLAHAARLEEGRVDSWDRTPARWVEAMNVVLATRSRLIAQEH